MPVPYRIADVIETIATYYKDFFSAIIIEVDMESDPATEGTQEVTVIPSDYQKGVHQ